MNYFMEQMQYFEYVLQLCAGGSFSKLIIIKIWFPLKSAKQTLPKNAMEIHSMCSTLVKNKNKKRGGHVGL